MPTASAVNIERFCITGELVVAAATLLAPLFVVTYQHELWQSKSHFTVCSAFPVVAVTLRLVAVRLHGTQIGSKGVQYTLSGVTLLFHVLFLVLWVAFYHSQQASVWETASGLHGLPGIFWFIAGLLMLFIVISFRVEDTPYHAERGKAQLDRLTVETFPATRLGDSATETCVICLQEYGTEGQMRKLRCGHFFHDECVTGWILHAALGCPYRCPEEGYGTRGTSTPEPDGVVPNTGSDSAAAEPPVQPGTADMASGSSSSDNAGNDWISVGAEPVDEAAISGTTKPEATNLGQPDAPDLGRESTAALDARWNWSSASI